VSIKKAVVAPADSCLIDDHSFLSSFSKYAGAHLFAMLLSMSIFLNYKDCADSA